MDFEENAAFRKYDDGSTEVLIIKLSFKRQIKYVNEGCEVNFKQ